MSKHLAQSKKELDGKKIVVSLALAGIFIGGSVIGHHFYKEDQIKKNDNSDLNSQSDEVQIITVPSVDTLFKSLKSNYKIYQNEDQQDFTTAGLILQYIENQISDLNISNNEKLEILNNLMSDGKLYENVYAFIQENSQNVEYFQEVPTDKENLNKTINDERLMAEIEKGSTDYHMPEEILVGLYANSINNPSLKNSGPYGVNNSIFGSERTAHNFTTNSDDRLTSYSNIAAYLSNALKSSNKNDKLNLQRDMGSAIECYIIGPNNIKLDIESDIRQNGINNKNAVITYASQYLKDKRIPIHYTYKGLNDEEITITYETNDYPDYVMQALDSVLTQIDINILQTYGYGIKK